MLPTDEYNKATATSAANSNALSAYAAESPLFSLPKELFFQCMSQLEIVDLGSFAAVSQLAQAESRQFMLLKAQKHQYRGSCELGAQKYLKQLLDVIRSVHATGEIPQTLFCFSTYDGYNMYRKWKFIPALRCESSLLRLINLGEDHIFKNISKDHANYNLLALRYIINGDINALDATGKTLLNRSKIDQYAIERILALQVDPNVPDQNGDTPLITHIGNIDIVKLLLAAGADVNHLAKEGSPLHYAILGGHFAVAQLLLEHGANPDAITAEGKTPLYLAADQGKNSFVELLLKFNANPNIADKNGFSPLTVNTSDESRIEMLLAHGANRDHRTNQGISALHFAAHNGQIESLKVLLSAGADINAVDNDGETPLYFASQNGSMQAVALLLCEKSIKPDLCNSDGFTPLIVAKSADITAALLQGGADIGYEVPGTERAALEYAIRNGEIDKVSVLLEYGMVHHKQCMYKQLERNVRALTCEMPGVLGITIAARRLTEKKHYAEAISLFHFAQDIGLGTDEYELEGLAQCYYHTEAHADQVEHCKKWALQNMECPTPHFFLYRCYLNVGLTELALLSMEIFLHRAHGKQEFEQRAAEARVEMNALRRRLLQKK